MKGGVRSGGRRGGCGGELQNPSPADPSSESLGLIESSAQG